MDPRIADSEETVAALLQVGGAEASARCFGHSCEESCGCCSWLSLAPAQLGCRQRCCRWTSAFSWALGPGPGPGPWLQHACHTQDQPRVASRLRFQPTTNCIVLQCVPNSDEMAALDTYRRSGKPISELADADRVLLGERVAMYCWHGRCAAGAATALSAGVVALFWFQQPGLAGTASGCPGCHCCRDGGDAAEEAPLHLPHQAITLMHSAICPCAEMMMIPAVEARLKCYSHKFSAPDKLASADKVGVHVWAFAGCRLSKSKKMCPLVSASQVGCMPLPPLRCVFILHTIHHSPAPLPLRCLLPISRLRSRCATARFSRCVPDLL